MLLGQHTHTARPATGAPPPVSPAQARQQLRRRPRCQHPNAARADATPHSSSIAAPAAAVAAEALRQWVMQHSPPLPADLAPAPVAGSGFGMVTRQQVQQGQALVRVPQQLMLTQDSARRSKACGSVCSQPDVTEWQALILHLLCERARGTDSFWDPYISMLGEQEHHPLLWGEAAQQLLHGSPMLAKLQDRLLQVQQDAAALIAAGANELEVAKQWHQTTQAPLVSESSVAWAAAVLLSRAFSLDMNPHEDDLAMEPGTYYGSWQAYQPDVLALVPWADMLAHSSEAGEEACLAFDQETACATLCAHRPYAPGEQVYDSYGPNLSPSDLLLDYGFVDRSNSNDRYDADPAGIVADPKPRNKALLAALAAVQGEGAVLALGVDGPDATGLTMVRAALAPDGELVRAGWRPRASAADVDLACRVMGRLSQPCSVDTERALLDAVSSFISSAQAAYDAPTSSMPTHNSDAATGLAQRSGDDAPSSNGQAGVASAVSSTKDDVSHSLHQSHDVRQHIAQEVAAALASERRALAGSAAAVAAWRAKLDSGCPLDELYEHEDE